MFSFLSRFCCVSTLSIVEAIQPHVKPVVTSDTRVSCRRTLAYFFAYYTIGVDDDGPVHPTCRHGVDTIHGPPPPDRHNQHDKGGDSGNGQTSIDERGLPEQALGPRTRLINRSMPICAKICCTHGPTHHILSHVAGTVFTSSLIGRKSSPSFSSLRVIVSRPCVNN